MSFVMPSAAEKVGCTMAAEPRTQPSASALNLARCRAWNAAEGRERFFMSAEEAREYGIVDRVIASH